MRRGAGLFLLVALPALGLAQSPAPQEPGAGKGRTIALEDLQGATISGVVNYTGRFRTELGESNSAIAWNYRIKIGPGSAVSLSTTRNVSWQTKGGPKTASISRSLSGTIGVAKQGQDGAQLWLLEANTLVLLRVFEVGGMAMRIALKSEGSGLSCTTTAPMVREVGAGPGKTKAAVGGKVEMLSMHQTSSTCRVAKG